MGVPIYRAAAVGRAIVVAALTTQLAAAEEPRHHVEATLGRGELRKWSRSHVDDPNYGYPTDHPRPEPLLRTFWGTGLGYRYRPNAWFEVSTTVAAERYRHSYRVAGPLLFHARVPLGAGHALSFGTGLGLDFIRGDVGDRRPRTNSCTGLFVQAQLGGSIRLSPEWSTFLTIDAQYTRGTCNLIGPDIDPGFGTDVLEARGLSSWSGLRRSF